MIRWLLPALLILGVFLIGGSLWWPPCAPADRYSDLGTALVGGGVVALAVFFLERLYAAEAGKRDVQLTLGIGDSFVGIDLRGRNLSRSYLAGKDFSGARFDRANLRSVNLSGSILSWVSLQDADLRGAKLSATLLYPSEHLYPSEDLFPGSIAPGGKPLGDAATQGINIRGASYDSATEWPEGFDPNKGSAVNVEELPWGWRWLRPWWRMFGG